MASKLLKLKAETKISPKPAPKVPVAGSGPRIEIPESLQKEIYYKPKVPVARRGPRIEIPESLQKEVIDYKPKVPVAGHGPEVKIPESLQKEVIDYKPKVAASEVKEALEAPVPVKETAKRIFEKLGDVVKKTGKSLVQEENPYRQAYKNVLKKAGLESAEKESVGILGKTAQIASGAGTAFKYGKLGARVVSRLATPLMAVEAAVSGSKDLYEIGQERVKAESALAASDANAKAFAKKYNYKVTRPEMKTRDWLGLTFIPGYEAPATDPNKIKVYDSSGTQLAGPRRRR